MSSSNLIRSGGLVAMVGSVVFVLVLLLRPWLPVAEAVALPMIFLLLVVVIVAIVAIVALLRGTPEGGLDVFVAGGGSLVGVVLVFAGLLMGFVGIVVIPVGVVVGTGSLALLAHLTYRTSTLPRWGRVALVAGVLPFILFVLPFHWLADSLAGVPWIVVGYAIFRAAGRRTERPSRVR
jgi:hypothetical protein